MTINNYLMGLVRPRVTSTITNLVYDYQLDDIHVVEKRNKYIISYL